jgi:hypothetical protein
MAAVVPEQVKGVLGDFMSVHDGNVIFVDKELLNFFQKFEYRGLFPESLWFVVNVTKITKSHQDFISQKILLL